MSLVAIAAKYQQFGCSSQASSLSLLSAICIYTCWEVPGVVAMACVLWYPQIPTQGLNVDTVANWTGTVFLSSSWVRQSFLSFWGGIETTLGTNSRVSEASGGFSGGYELLLRSVRQIT